MNLSVNFNLEFNGGLKRFQAQRSVFFFTDSLSVGAHIHLTATVSQLA